MRWSSALLEAWGYEPADASFIADSLVDANLRGVDSHGVLRLPAYARRVDEQLVDREGRLLVDGEARFGAAASSWWAERAAKRKEGRRIAGGPGDELPTLVVIRADREAPYGEVRKTLATAQAKGFARFTLVVLRPEEPLR